MAKRNEVNQDAYILITGRDSKLLDTRRSVLRSAGYQVSMTLEPVTRSAALASVRLLILCHTLTPAERERDLSMLALGCPQARALCLVPHQGAAQSGIPILDSFAGPREMLRVVGQLLGA